jgi:tRNA threonylcarbamoyl adenosine modification protein (Sua5/YciO/YrdC/YwlC family)
MTVYDIHPVNPQKRVLEAAARILSNGDGVAVYPTDTVYGMGACVTNPKGIDKIARISEKDKNRPVSFICNDFSQISKYVKLSNTHYRLMKRCLPGPYTFILNATSLVPKRIMPKRKTVGIRMPDCVVTLELVKLLGEPLANRSINIAGKLVNEPCEIKAAVRHDVDVMLDAGPLDNPAPSTVIDLTGDTPTLIRQGKGEWDDSWN